MRSIPHTSGEASGQRDRDARAVLPEGTAAPGQVPAEIFAAAVDAFTSGQRLDMRSLARRLGVARATLYRRAGNRDRLLDELLWWRARRLLDDQVRASTGLAGTARLVAVIGGVLHSISTDRPLRVFLESDPETALRLLTGAGSAVHAGTAGALENLIDLERRRGSFEASIDTPTLAYAIVRLSEGFLYADVIAARAPDGGRAPDIDRAITLIEVLLLGLDLSSFPERGPAFRCSPRRRA